MMKRMDKRRTALEAVGDIPSELRQDVEDGHHEIGHGQVQHEEVHARQRPVASLAPDRHHHEQVADHGQHQDHRQRADLDHGQMLVALADVRLHGQRRVGLAVRRPVVVHGAVFSFFFFFFVFFDIRSFFVVVVVVVGAGRRSRHRETFTGRVGFGSPLAMASLKGFRG